MSAEGKTITPVPLLQEDVPYVDLLKHEQEDASWDLDVEGELAVDVLETPKDLVIRSAIAGVKPEDLSIHVTADTLTIRGSRERCETHPFAETHIEECHWGSFSRTVILPHNIQIDGVLATMKHGILTITLPKSNAASDVEVLSAD